MTKTRAQQTWDYVNKSAQKQEQKKPPTASEMDRFLSGGAPDEYDHDREE